MKNAKYVLFVLAAVILITGIIKRPHTATMPDLEGLNGTRGAIVHIKPGTQPNIRSIEDDSCGQLYEVGSLSKAMTGLVLADAIDKGELSLDTPLPSRPEITVKDLVTHTSGLPRLSNKPTAIFSSLINATLGRNPYAFDEGSLSHHINEATLGDRTYEYSNLGAAATYELFPKYLGGDYATVMKKRLFEPLGMNNTEVQTADSKVCTGQNEAGVSQQRWTMTEYAPAGGIVSTPQDLALLAQALATNSAPGQSALEPLTKRSENSSAGVFWVIDSPTDTNPNTPPITWHNGATGGYGSFLGLNPDTGEAVVVVSNTPGNQTAIGKKLLGKEA
ncbi:serine hydrolase domain-containing protein [Corynebacterium aquilae]|uniref:Beta-lactamase n=1 Tax=Corynebacterium aquilae DSM 44791 TaxID=1431546 RepID=A0A1L7CG79_9CORY|nr:serine hydrolase domain-containing protein [Corynebacterium aquilae]APT84834.1 hypothetical protein CAQU_06865 [Corynebacterium aquilae DSM 44791]